MRRSLPSLQTLLVVGRVGNSTPATHALSPASSGTDEIDERSFETLLRRRTKRNLQRSSGGRHDSALWTESTKDPVSHRRSALLVLTLHAYHDPSSPWEEDNVDLWASIGLAEG